MTSGTLRLAALRALFALGFALAGCKASPSRPAGVLARPLDQLTKADLERVCASLGWDGDGVSSASSGAASQMAARCSRESPDGVEGPDRKRRRHMLVEIYKDRPDGLERIKKRMESEQAAYRVEGERLLGVSLVPGAKDQAQVMLERMAGK